MTNIDIQTARSIAAELHRAAENRAPCAPIRSQIRDADVLSAAYAIQEINTVRALANGRRLVGRKIGLTSLAVQKQLGVDQPDFGMLFEDMRVASGSHVPIGRLIQPKIEAEVAFILKAPLFSSRPTIEALVEATDYACAALEIVDSRIVNWDIHLQDTIADNASSGLFVLSDERHPLAELDLVGCKMFMRWCETETVSSGTGAHCMGNPLNAALWLAGKMVELGRPLQTGDCILSGALGPMVAARQGDSFAASIEGLGTVSVSFD